MPAAPRATPAAKRAAAARSGPPRAAAVASRWAGGRGLNETVASAMREALARPRLTPLPAAPIHVVFAPGRTEPAPNAARQLAAIAEILSARPDVTVELRGAGSREDRRWLAEQAVTIDDTEEPGALRGFLRAIGFRDQRQRIRDALAARREGRPGRLDPDDEAVLAELVAAAPPIADDRLTSLAASRSTLVANLLAAQHGVTATRVVAAEPEAPDAGMAPVVDARFLPAPEAPPW